jgi:hypothetical protein
MWVFAGLLGLPILAANLVLERITKCVETAFIDSKACSSRWPSRSASPFPCLPLASVKTLPGKDSITLRPFSWFPSWRTIQASLARSSTRVSILNVAPLNYSIKATLYNQNGKVNEVTIRIANGQQQNYENFLQEVFAYQGAGTVELDAWFGILGGSSDNKFLLNVEVYTESPSGRYKTIVIPADNISSSFPAFSPGIYVDANSRTNIGCFNDGFGTNLIQADHSPAGTLINTYQMDLGEDSWNQIGLGDPVSGGYIRWRPTSSCFCYSVVVDNTSNDGSFIPATIYIQ